MLAKKRLSDTERRQRELETLKIKIEKWNRLLECKVCVIKMCSTHNKPFNYRNRIQDDIRIMEKRIKRILRQEGIKQISKKINRPANYYDNKKK